MIRPAALQTGARIALIAPAGPLAPEAVDRAVTRVTDMGWVPHLGAHARCRQGYLAGNDDKRAADLAWAIDAPTIDGIWCLRGGYGTMRLLERHHLNGLAERPRPLIGFSDNTVLHLALQRLGVVSFHGPHPAAADFNSFSRDALERVLTRTAPAGELPFPHGHPPARTVREGRAEGLLVGGNLALLSATLGTPFAVDAAGAILFFEDVGEAVYRIDRLLSQLRLAGVFHNVAGIAVGQVSDCPDVGAEDMPTPEEVLRDRLGDLGVPVAIGFPFGHVADNWTLPLGVRARLDADTGTLDLLEAAVE